MTDEIKKTTEIIFADITGFKQEAMPDVDTRFTLSVLGSDLHSAASRNAIQAYAKTVEKMYPRYAQSLVELSDLARRIEARVDGYTDK